MTMGVTSCGTYSYVGTTSGANQEFTFDGLTLNNLLVIAVGNIVTVKINDESYTHVIETGAAISFEQIRIKKLTVIESGVSLKLEGTNY